MFTVKSLSGFLRWTFFAVERETKLGGKFKTGKKNRDSHQREECQKKHDTQDADEETVTSNSKVEKLWESAIL